ncbi:hypothetical protein BGZ68_004685 [Mortierella alpina]|nr:hypothetical protein BGZ68_004685 [Mortierella alpina]
MGTLDADIVCVQEVDEPDYGDEFGTTMDRLGYAGSRSCMIAPSLVRGVEHAGVMLVLELDDGQQKRRAWPDGGADVGIEVKLRKDPTTPFLLTGDFNSALGSPIYQIGGGSRVTPRRFARIQDENREARQLVDPSNFATKAEELRALTKEE